MSTQWKCSLLQNNKTRYQQSTEYVKHDYEKKDLMQLSDIDHSFSNVSNMVDDSLFDKETVMCGLKRKREPENIVGTKKSKKRLRRL